MKNPEPLGDFDPIEENPMEGDFLATRFIVCIGIGIVLALGIIGGCIIALNKILEP